MQAIAWTNYGSPEVLKLKKFDKPSPKQNEVLIRVYASSVTAGDTRLRAINVPSGFAFLTRLAFGLRKPRKQIIGMDVSGEIESVGEAVTQFKRGDKVFGTAGMKLGANAEYVCLPQTAALIKKPENISYEEAAAIVFGGMTAVHFLKNKAHITSGHKVLVNGASGAVGTAAIQIVNYLGAEVTGICSGANIELVKSLGAKSTIDYTKVNINQKTQKYDVVLDAVGNFSVKKYSNLLTKDGKLILINANLLTILFSIVKGNVICGVAEETKEPLCFLKQLVDEGKFSAVIDRTYSLEQVSDAHRYVDSARKKGNVVISIQPKIPNKSIQPTAKASAD